MTGYEMLGKKIGPYYLEGVISGGTFTVIYRALDENGQVVALKLLAPPHGAGPDILARFEREAKTTSRLKHPNIVPVLDSGRLDNLAYLTMPLIQGETLADLLKRKTRLDEVTVIDIGWQIANALDYAHSQGVIHRDVKPSNVMLTSDDHAMLTDFGVAQTLDDPGLTQAGHIIGTPAYMAPEQALESQTVDGRADLYSLGVMLYRMITGRLPFSGTTPQLLHAHVYDRSPAPSAAVKLSPTLDALILRLMAKNPNDRYQTGAMVAQTLSRLSHQLREQAPQKGPLQTAMMGCFARLGFGTVLIAGLILLLFGFSLF